MSDGSGHWDALVGNDVVVDTTSRYVYVGTLAKVLTDSLELVDADVHDLRDTQTTRDLYVLEARRYGTRRNRSRVWVRIDQVVSVSRLADVVDE